MSAGALLLLDTTVLIDALRNRNQRRGWLEKRVVAGSVLAVSAVTIAELYAGLRSGEETATRAQLANLEWLPVTAAIAERAGLLKAGLRREGRTHSIAGMMIAATALENGCELATDNRRDFQIVGVVLAELP
jgi:predicted nucleic acid-binding protein